MRLFNQRREPIQFEAGGVVYSWESYGACNVPDHLLQAMKDCKFPVGFTSVAPERKAAAVAEDATAAQRGDELVRLRSELDLANAGAVNAAKSAEASAAQLTAMKTAVIEAQSLASQSAERAELIEKDRAALEGLLTETATKLEAAEQRATQAEAMLAEAAKSAEASATDPSAPEKSGKPEKPKK